MTTPFSITEPGLYHDVPERDYHADPCPEPSLSSSVARTLFNRSPFHAWLEHPRLGGAGKMPEAPSAGMILGSTVHALLAGETGNLDFADFDDFRSKDARAWRDGVLAAGRTPVLERVRVAAEPVAGAIRECVAAGFSDDQNPLLAGRAEVVAAWRDDGGVRGGREAWCRARFDRVAFTSTHATILDFKVTEDAAPERLERHVIDMGYHVQAAFYLRGLYACRPRSEKGEMRQVSFVFYFCEAPTLSVVPVVLSQAHLNLGDKIADHAIRAWAGCMAAGGQWPSYCSGGRALALSVPDWYLRRVEERLGA